MHSTLLQHVVSELYKYSDELYKFHDITNYSINNEVVQQGRKINSSILNLHFTIGESHVPNILNLFNDVIENACFFRINIIKVGFMHTTVIICFLPFYTVIQTMVFIIEIFTVLACVGHGAFVILTALKHSCSRKYECPCPLFVQVDEFREGFSSMTFGSKDFVYVPCFRVYFQALWCCSYTV